jgi:anti-sigma-K factor RskA
VNGCHSHADLVGGYVLGALDPAEEVAMRQHLEECEDCRREYETLAGIPALLDRIVPADVPPPEPSPALEEAVLDRVATERSRRRRRPRLAWPPKLALAGAAAAVAVAVVVALLVRSPGADTAYAYGNLRGAPGADGSFTVQEVPAGTQVDLSVEGLRSRRAAYELWCVRTDGRWVSGGSFHPSASGEADVRMTAAVAPGDYHVVVITRPADGDRGPEVLRGELRY